ncbi:MAG: hypothetical protein ACT4QA_08900 [Panacagrimonas sp.]
MTKRKVQQVRLSRLLSTGLCAALTACGSGGGSSDDPAADAYLVAAVPFTLSGSQPALNLSDPDAVLVAALAAVSAARSIAVGDIRSFDRGAPAPGDSPDSCDSGSTTESIVETPGGIRTVTLTSDQCFVAAAETVFDGPLELSYSRPSAGLAQGNLELGAGSDPIVTGRAQRIGTGLSFEQQRGRVAFDGSFDGSTGTSVANGLALIFGAGPRPSGIAALAPDRQIEALAGNASVDFSVGLVTDGVINEDYDIAGPMSISGAGAGLSPRCAFAASFQVATNTSVRIDRTVDSTRAGMLILSTDAGSATVAFDDSGSAQVDTGTGVPQTYPATAVQSFCGF